MLENTFDSLREALAKEVRFQAVTALLGTLKVVRTTLYYSQAAPIVGFHHRDAAFWSVLGATMFADDNVGRPLACSLIISKSKGNPGNSYFVAARRLGYVIGLTPKDEHDFWLNQLELLGVSPPT